MGRKNPKLLFSVVYIVIPNLFVILLTLLLGTCWFADYLRESFSLKSNDLAKGFFALNIYSFLLIIIFFISYILSYLPIKKQEKDFYVMSGIFSFSKWFNCEQFTWLSVISSVINIILLALLCTIESMKEWLKGYEILIYVFMGLSFSFSVYLFLCLKKATGLIKVCIFPICYAKMYILSRDPVLFLAGIFYNLLIFLTLLYIIRSQINSADSRLPSPLSFLAIWSSSLAFWMGPFIRAWFQIFSNDFIDEYYRKTLSRVISNLNKHRVLLGFGGLGRGVQTELLKRMEEKDILKRKVPLLDPSDASSIKYLVKDMVVVDRDERLFDKVFVDPALENIGIAKLKYDKITYDSKNNRLKIPEEKEEVWIPAIIGDFIDESVIDNCALCRCEFFIDTIEGYEESIRISKFAHEKPETNGIIAVSDSAQKKFLFPRHSGHGVFLTYPTQQRGISLGEVVYPAMIRRLKNDRFLVPPNVLIFTDDIRQTHYMIETILEELKMGDQLNHYLGRRYSPSSGEYVDLKIVICGEADEIKRRCNPKSPQRASLDLDVRKWVEIVERCAAPEYAWAGEKYYIKSKVIVEIPHLMIMEKIITHWNPKVVVISYKSTADILKVLHDWIIAVERCNSPLSKKIKNGGKIVLSYYPKIIVGYHGEEERDVRDWLQYYDALCRDSDEKWQKYPVQAIDCMVDLNKDSREEISAIAEAMYKNK